MAKSLKRVTVATKTILSVFLEENDTELFGLEIVRRSGYAAGTVYPILDRLEGLGWLEAFIELQGELKVGRPSRRYYKLTKGGSYLAAQLFEDTDATSVTQNPISISNFNRQTYKPKFRSREEHAIFKDGLIIGKGKHVIEVDPDSPTQIRMPFIQETDLDSEDQFPLLDKLCINSIDFTDSDFVQEEKIVLDLVNKRKTLISAVTFSSTVAGNSRSLELELDTTTNYANSNSIISSSGFSDQPEYVSLQIEAPGYSLHPNTNYLSKEFISCISSSSELMPGSTMDLRESDIAAKDLTFVNDSVVWRPKKVEPDYLYLFDF